MTLFALFIKRYLFTFRKNAYLTLFVLLSLFMMTVGVAALILTQAFMDGAQDIIRSYHLARTPHLLLLHSGAEETPPPGDELLSSLPHVTKVTRQWRSNGWIHTPSRMLPVTLIAGSGVKSPTLSLSVAQMAGLAPGDPLSVVLPVVGLSPLGPAPKRKTLIFYKVGGAPESDPALYLPLSWVRKEIDPKAFPTRIIMTCNPPEAALSLPEQLRPLLSGRWKIRTYRDLNRPLFYALTLEKWLMFLGVAFILLIAALQLATSLRLVVLHHRTTFVLFRLHGLARPSIRRFLGALGLFIGFSGTLLGAVTAWGITLIVHHTHLLSMAQALTFFGEIPLSLHPATLGWIGAITLFLSLIASRDAAACAMRLPLPEILHAP